MMKIKNNFFTGFIIGASFIVFSLFLMGASNKNNVSTFGDIGKYQISTTTMGNGENYIFETIIDTETGRVTSRNRKPWRQYDF